MPFLISVPPNLSKKPDRSIGKVRPKTRNLPVHKELRHVMRSHSTTLCGRIFCPPLVMPLP